MNKRSLAIVVVSTSSLPLARQIKKQFPDAVIYSKESEEETVLMESIDSIMGDLFLKTDAIVFIGAMGICVRCIAPYIMDKHTDPAVVCIDSTGKYIIPVLSGHIGGANELSTELAQLLGGNAIVTTQSDNTGLGIGYAGREVRLVCRCRRFERQRERDEHLHRRLRQ